LTIADSLWIAEYLDETYPDTPTLVPKGTHTLHTAFNRAFTLLLSEDYWDLVYGRTSVQLNPRSKEWYEKKEWRKELESEQIGLQKTQEDLAKLESWYKPGEPFVGGSDLILADLQVAGFIGWLRTSLGEESDQWQEVLKWNNGRWKALFDKLKPFEQVL
jgi:glutathione S-transferase